MTDHKSRPQETATGAAAGAAAARAAGAAGASVDRTLQNSLSRDRDAKRPDVTAIQDTPPAVSQPESASARAHRAHSRSTLQPSVQDFNGKIINRTLGGDPDEDQILWTVVGTGGAGGAGTGGTAGGGAGGGGAGGGSRFHLKLPLSAKQADDHTACPAPIPPATFRWTSNPLTPLHLDATRLPLAPTVIKSERVAAWTEDVHRRHVTRTARARARLMPKPWVRERVVVPSGQTGAGVDNVGLEPSFRLSASHDGDGEAGGGGGGGGGGGDEDARCSQRVKPSQNSPRKELAGALTARSRPATTTGRYFDRGNGLRSHRSAHTARSRPKTAGHWTWSSPGLSIQKVVLRRKELT